MVESEYAKAVYDLAVEEKKINVFSECFKTVSDTVNKDFLEILTSPFINSEEKKKIISKVYQSLDETFVNFMKVLIDHNRFGLVNAIKDEYESIVLKTKNIIMVELLSAHELTSSQISKFKDTLESQYPGKTVQIKNTVKPDLIGGVHFIMDEKSIDASIRGTLDKIRESL